MAEAARAKALYICIDGLDGSGKTTQARMLHDYFVASELQVRIVPFVPQASKPLRQAAKQRYGSESAMRVAFSRSHVEYVHACEQFLNFQDHIAPYLDTHDAVIQDRSKLSRLVNARYAQTPLEDVRAILNQFPDPDALFYLKTSPATALGRIVLRGDVGQDETSDYLDRAAVYFDEFGAELGAHFIDAQQTPEEVQWNIISEISKMALVIDPRTELC